MSHNYFTMLINSILIPMFVGFKFQDHVFSKEFSSWTVGMLFPSLFSNVDSHNYSSDIDRQWYVTVGNVMIAAIYYQTFMPFVYLPLDFYNDYKRKNKAQNSIV